MGGKVIMQIDKVTPQMKCAVFLAGQRYRGTKQGRGNETGTRERNRDAGTKQGRGNETGTRERTRDAYSCFVLRQSSRNSATCSPADGANRRSGMAGFSSSCRTPL
jgi:hypothetical protein